MTPLDGTSTQDDLMTVRARLPADYLGVFDRYLEEAFRAMVQVRSTFEVPPRVDLLSRRTGSGRFGAYDYVDLISDGVLWRWAQAAAGTIGSRAWELRSAVDLTRGGEPPDEVLKGPARRAALAKAKRAAEAAEAVEMRTPPKVPTKAPSLPKTPSAPKAPSAPGQDRIRALYESGTETSAADEMRVRTWIDRNLDNVLGTVRSTPPGRPTNVEIEQVLYRFRWGVRKQGSALLLRLTIEPGSREAAMRLGSATAIRSWYVTVGQGPQAEQRVIAGLSALRQIAYGETPDEEPAEPPSAPEPSGRFHWTEDDRDAGTRTWTLHDARNPHADWFTTKVRLDRSGDLYAWTTLEVPDTAVADGIEYEHVTSTEIDEAKGDVTERIDEAYADLLERGLDLLLEAVTNDSQKKKPNETIQEINARVGMDQSFVYEFSSHLARLRNERPPVDPETATVPPARIQLATEELLEQARRQVADGAWLDAKDTLDRVARGLRSPPQPNRPWFWLDELGVIYDDVLEEIGHVYLPPRVMERLEDVREDVWASVADDYRVLCEQAGCEPLGYHGRIPKEQQGFVFGAPPPKPRAPSAARPAPKAPTASARRPDRW